MAVDLNRNGQRRLQAYIEVPLRTKSVAKRELRCDPSGDISMPSTIPLPHKRNLPQPDTNTHTELEKQQLMESSTDTLPPKTVTKHKDTVKGEKVPGSDPKPPDKTTAKKAKITTSTKLGGAGDTLTSKPLNASEEFPNGHLYCHQCNKKRDASQVVSCTEAVKRCKAKYCKPCLSNRYGEDIEKIKMTPPSGRGKNKMPYTFKCPRCQGTCNCRTCRRAQGLEPTGNLTNAARKVGISAAELLDANPDQKGILPGQGQGRKDTKAAASPAVHPAGKTRPTQTPTLKTVGKPTIKLKPKPAKPLIPVIQPTWTKLYNVPREITREHIEERMFIREFILRFSSLMSKETKAHLDELGEIIGDGSVDWVANEDDQNQDAPDIPLVSWVSEKCIRSVVFGLLGIYADEAAGPLKKSLQTALKEIKNSSANMTKIWATLASLRYDFPNDFTYSDPLPPPTTMPVYNTRRGAIHQDGIPVGHSAQLVHVVLELIEGLMMGGSKTLKAEIDNSINEVKEITRLGKEAITRENERWIKEKTRLGTVKPPRPFRDAHKTRLDDLEKAQQTLISCSTFRFSSLGRDNEGRRYFAFSPSFMERETSLDIISDDLGEVGTAPRKSTGGGRRRGTAFTSGAVGAMDESKREELWNWDWFVAVWGRRPEGAVIAHNPDQDEDGGNTTDGDEDHEDHESEGEHRSGERWWAFWRPEDIRNLSRWIAYSHELEHEDDNRDLKATEKAAFHAMHHKASIGLLYPPTGHSATASTVDTFSDRASTNFDRDAMAVDETDNTNTDGVPEEGSPLTDFDESDDESGHELMDSPPNGKLSQRAVKELVNALSGYAQLLEWRVQRGERERKAKQRD